MLNVTRNVSMRISLKPAAVVLLLMGAMGVASAATNVGVAPQLVPNWTALLGGNPNQESTANTVSSGIGGYGGDGQLATASTLNSPNLIAVDSVGNVYFPDANNAVIREINAQTGVINTVAGAHPTLCTGTAACHVNSGCSDGVQAVGNPIGSNVQGIAIDAYGNIYFSDATTESVSVVYRAGTQVAAFIALVDPTAAASASAVKPGYVYHVAGTVNLSNCAGTASRSASTSQTAISAGDGNLAFNSGATFGNVGSVALDSAGNLFIGDGGVNNTIRVVNTQAVSQTYFGTKVLPGYIASIADCGALTSLCPPGNGTTPLTIANTGEGGPPQGGVFNTFSSGNGNWMTVDAYGNIYELNTRGATPGIYLGVAYAGGPTLGKLVNNALNAQGTVNSGGGQAVVNANTLTATVGDFYYLLQSVTLRPSSIGYDASGNLYYEDNHYGQVYRIDANSVSNASNFLGVQPLYLGGAANSTNRASAPAAGTYVSLNTGTYVPANPATATAGAFTPATVTGTYAYCYGNLNGGLGASTTNPTTAGYTTTNIFGDGCPAAEANGTGAPHGGTGYGTVIGDGPGNVFIADRTNDLIREIALGNRFPATPVGKSTQQTLQIHFDGGNLPVQLTPQPTVTTSSVVAGTAIPDFVINPISSTYTTTAASPGSGLQIGSTTFSSASGSLTGTATSPVCANTNGSADFSLDCAINVVFTPTAPGVRTSQLIVTTANGSVYHLSLTGIGTGPQLAVDGGAQTTVPLSGLGNTGQVSVGPTGALYVADPANNRIVVSGGGSAAQTFIGPALTGVTPATLKNPLGVTVDGAGNVFISDTGNNRILEIPQVTGTATVPAAIVLGAIMAQTASPGFGPAYTNYAFKAPQGIAVDVNGNVYVADTGNSKVVEIPSNFDLGGATPLLQYPGAPTFSSPVAVALDKNGNIYVADPGLIQIVEIPAGGGDLQSLPGGALAGFGSILTSPSGVAVDGAGNIYVSDSGTNQVYELPSASGLSTTTVPLNFTGLNLTASSPIAFAGGSIALDANGNLYVADSGNSQVLFDNRQNPTVACGTVPQNQPPTTCGSVPLKAGANTLTVTNIGNVSVPLTSPFTTVTGTSPTGNTAFTLSNTCTGTLLPGAFCTISPTFIPTTDGPQSETVSLNGTQTITLTGTGQQPLAKIVLSVTSPASGPVAGSPATITATLTQPNIAGDTPTGTVSFTYTVDGVSAGAATMPMLSGAGGTSTASFTIPASAMLQGRLYVINATYQGDTLDTPTTATPLSIYLPGIPVTAVSTSVSYTYGTAVPKLSGTVTPDPTASGVTYTFTTAATASSPVGVYPISVVFAGGNYLNYGFPPVVTSTGAPAVVTENPAPLSVKANNATSPYGGQNLSYTSVVTGLVNGDKVSESYALSSGAAATSSILNVGTYTLVPSVIGKATGNYAVTVSNGTLTITSAPTVVSISPAAPSVLPTALTTDPVTVSVATLVTAGSGTPTGTVTITDTFTPITATAPGTGAASAPVTIGPLTLALGLVKYTPTSAALGTHSYTVTYSGDSNFQGSTTVAPTTLIVDNQDFTVTSTTNPIQIAPGVLPGGNTAVSGEAAATPEQATVTVASVLSFTGTVTLTCQPQSPSYVSCSLAPPAVTVPAPASGSTSATITSVLSISTPATLPINFNFGAAIRQPATQTVLAFLPLGVLAFCFRRRRRLSKALWMLLAIALTSAGLNGCGDNSVHYFTPVPSGPQIVTVFATGTSPTTNTIVTRSFVVQINIQ